MPHYEYKVIPAPKRGRRTKGAKGTEARFAFALQSVMNEQADEGWDYLRTDTLPCEERSGLTGRTTVFQNMLVFRRAQDTAEESATSAIVASPLPLTTAVAVAKDTADELEVPKAETVATADRAAPTIENVVDNARSETPSLGGAKRDDEDNPDLAAH